MSGSADSAILVGSFPFKSVCSRYTNLVLWGCLQWSTHLTGYTEATRVWLTLSQDNKAVQTDGSKLECTCHQWGMDNPRPYLPQYITWHYRQYSRVTYQPPYAYYPLRTCLLYQCTLERKWDHLQEPWRLCAECTRSVYNKGRHYT